MSPNSHTVAEIEEYRREWSQADRPGEPAWLIAEVKLINWLCDLGVAALSDGPEEQLPNKVLCPYCNPLFQETGAAPQSDGGEVNLLAPDCVRGWYGSQAQHDRWALRPVRPWPCPICTALQDGSWGVPRP